jgi:hypothetical protein
LSAHGKRPEADPVASPAVAAEAAAREAADATKQDAATAATDSELSAETARAQAAEAAKQDAATAATDSELAAQKALLDAAAAAELAARQAADTAEATARANADTAINNAIGAETSARQAADALLQPKSEKGHANGYPALDANNQLSVGSEPDASIDGVDSLILLRALNDNQNALTIKRNRASWGVGQYYGTGQVLELLKDQALNTDIGYTASVPDDGVLGPDDDLVLMRITPDGSLGLGGNFHLATGLRQPQGYGGGPDTGWGCLYINPYVDVAPISIKPQIALTKPYMRGYASDGTTLRFQLNSDGQLQLPTQGNLGGVLYGGDTQVYRSAVKTLTVGGAIIAQSGIGVVPTAGADTTNNFLSGNNANYSAMQTGRAAAEAQWAVANAANFLFTGVAAGDSLIRQIAGKLHIGVASGAAELRIGDSQLGFFGTAPVAKPTVSGSRGGNAALASLLTALAGLGLLTDSSTA